MSYVEAPSKTMVFIAKAFVLAPSHYYSRHCSEVQEHYNLVLMYMTSGFLRHWCETLNFITAGNALLPVASCMKEYINDHTLLSHLIRRRVMPRLLILVLDGRRIAEQ